MCILFHQVLVHGGVLFGLLVDVDGEECVEQDVGVEGLLQLQRLQIGDDLCAADVEILFHARQDQLLSVFNQLIKLLVAELDRLC